jgi:hypothetical protein
VNVEASEKKPEEKEKKSITLSCSVFFDGTLNSRDNTLSQDSNKAVNTRMAEDSDSYKNALTNVAKMEQFVGDSAGYTITLPALYIEGPGTEEVKEDKRDKNARRYRPPKNAGYQSDSTAGFAFGLGGTGVRAKVRKGMSKLVNRIKKDVTNEVIIDELIIDVFGFSRGAAGARFFVHEVLNEEPSQMVVEGQVIEFPANPLFLRLQRAQLNIEAVKVTFRFVGLYDTVASCGVGNWDQGTQLLKLDAIKHDRVKKVVHLCAADEHRANFSLTNIKSAGDKGTEVYLPGVHSDIGGSYTPNEQDVEALSYAENREILEEDRNKLIQQGWFSEVELVIEERSWYQKAVMNNFVLQPNRLTIGNEYDQIPLNIMAEFAKKEGLVLEGDFSDEYEVNEEVKELSTANKELRKHADSGKSAVSDWYEKTDIQWLKTLRGNYLHFSSHYKATKKVVYPNKPNIKSVDGTLTDDDGKKLQSLKRERHVYKG